MKFLDFKIFVISVLTLTFIASCAENDDPQPTTPEVRNDFHIAFASGSGSNSATLLQGITDLSQGTITSRTGYSLESSRTARIFASPDNSTIYSLNYTVGTVEKLTYHGQDRYNRVTRVDASVPLGTTRLRFTKLDDKTAVLHYIVATPQYEGEGTNAVYQKHKMVANIGLLDLETMTIKPGYKSAMDIEIDDELAKQGYFISRIDAPVISGGKLYYGTRVSKFNASTGKADPTDRTFTLVIDYPSLSNPTTISRTDVKGSTNGYRTPTQYMNESGEILQMVSGNNKVQIVKIKNGKYDTSFNYDLSKLLNKPATSSGWFYAGNGIGYIPYEDLSTERKQIGVNAAGEPTFSAMWKLARMDFNKGTVVDLNVPNDLWLVQYQTSAIRDGIFYIALSPIGVDGHIYMFDVKSESKDGTLGASISGTGADQYYIGIY